MSIQVLDKNTIDMLNLLTPYITPIVVGLFGFFVFRMNKNFEHLDSHHNRTPHK